MNYNAAALSIVNVVFIIEDDVFHVSCLFICTNNVQKWKERCCCLQLRTNLWNYFSEI